LRIVRVSNASRWEPQWRPANAVPCDEAASLAREGLFVESSELMNGARLLLSTPTTDAIVVVIDAAQMRREA
jgi:hypothetical protein